MSFQRRSKQDEGRVREEPTDGRSRQPPAQNFRDHLQHGEAAIGNSQERGTIKEGVGGSAGFTSKGNVSSLKAKRRLSNEEFHLVPRSSEETPDSFFP